MSEAFLRCPAFVSGGGDGGVGNVHREVGPVEDSAVKGFDVVAVDALLAGAGAGEADGALLPTSFLPEFWKLFRKQYFCLNQQLPGKCR